MQAQTLHNGMRKEEHGTVYTTQFAVLKLCRHGRVKRTMLGVLTRFQYSTIPFKFAQGSILVPSQYS